MAATEDWSFRAEAVTKVCNGTDRANDGITLRVEPGEVYGLLGPNGAGVDADVLTDQRRRTGWEARVLM